jgi:hypothetical protein
MTRHVHSTPAHGSKRALNSVKLSRSNERKRIGRNGVRRHARPKDRIESESNARLLARSEEFLKNLLKEFNMRPTNSDDIFGVVLNAELGKKFRHKKRSDQRKALAAGCALYHLTLHENDSVVALQRLAKSMNVDLPRASDPYRIIVECLTDYGATKDERTLNRQFAARDARALSYVIRKKMDPQQITKPEKGESITKWADREAKFPSQKKRCVLVPKRRGPGALRNRPNGSFRCCVRRNSAIVFYRNGPRRACSWSLRKIMDARWLLSSRRSGVSPLIKRNPVRPK